MRFKFNLFCAIPTAIITIPSAITKLYYKYSYKNCYETFFIVRY